MKIEMLSDEYWYGGFVTTGEDQPYSKETTAEIDLTVNNTPNQGMPLFLSTHGRYLWRDTGYNISFSKGIITVPDDVILNEGFKTLRGAYIDAKENHFKPHEIKLDDILFSKPQYNSWIELVYDQNEADILKYAQDIINHGFEPGVLMIDDGWSNSYGDWTFGAGNFPNPEEMLDKLNKMGFKVMLWVCPFITSDTGVFRETRDMDLLIKLPDGKPYICEWWNGYSAVLDFSNPQAVKYFDEKLQKLLDIGVGGFKLDAGDAYFYNSDIISYGNASPNEHSRLWAEFGERYSLNEYRASFKAAGMSLMQRLGDKAHSWDNNGLKTLMPHTLTLGITGHPFSCPDMIGGGEFTTFLNAYEHGLDEELFCRHSEVACMLPAMQFSAAPWRVLSKESYEMIKISVGVRERYIDKIMEAVRYAKLTGEPIVRYMEYVFPHCGFADVTNQFMVGDSLLIAPIVQKGATSRTVAVPKGKWIYLDRKLVSSGELITITPPKGEPIVLSMM